MPAALKNNSPSTPNPPLASSPRVVPLSGVGSLLRWHLTGLSLLAVLTLGGQIAIQYAVSRQPHGLTASQLQPFQYLEAGALAVTLLALLAQATLVLGPGRVRRTLDSLRTMEAHMTDRDAALAEADRQMTEMRNLLANLSTMDALTGLKNHRAFQEQLEVELGRALRHDRPLSLLLIDVDRFKSYNEAYGHPNGDRALKRIAGVLKENARTSDIPARFGGEEFAVILTETDMMGSVVLGERLRQAISGGDGLHRPLTASIGIATLTPSMCGAAELISQADRALCSAKGDGRNRISHAHQLPATEDHETPMFAHAA